jgi:hypothetical protein
MSEPIRHKVFLAQPNAGCIKPQCVLGLGRAAREHDAVVQPSQFGDVAHNFNMLWCDALNRRESEGFTHFAMLHADIDACQWWLDILLSEMDRLDAEVVCTTIAIKDMRGLTTTGIRYPGVWGTRRFTMRESMAQPETISIADVGDPDTEILAINTGCWVARLDTGWADKFPGFTDHYKIAWEGGRAVPWFDSEDWLFSDWLSSMGLPYYATRKVKASHIGELGYPNDHAWGTLDTDFQCPTKPITDALRKLPAPGITIETAKPVAVDSLDHTQPLGTIADNSKNPKFNAKLYELIPAKEVRLLDLGCAGGGLVRSILEDGGFAVGVEGSDISRNSKRAEWGIIPDWLFTADCTEPFQLCNGKPLKFNVVTGWEFLEHIPQEKLPAVAENIRRHADPDALFIGSISRKAEPHHATVHDKGWWASFLAGEGISRSLGLESHFGDDLVRGHADPESHSFSFAGSIYP